MTRKTKKCSNCQGTGKISYVDWGMDKYNRSTHVTSDKPCYRCNGTGKEKIE